MNRNFVDQPPTPDEIRHWWDELPGTSVERAVRSLATQEGREGAAEALLDLHERSQAQKPSGRALPLVGEDVVLERLEEPVNPGVELKAESEGHHGVDDESNDHGDQDGDVHTAPMMPHPVRGE